MWRAQRVCAYGEVLSAQKAEEKAAPHKRRKDKAAPLKRETDKVKWWSTLLFWVCRKHTSILDRWQKDEAHRTSQLVHGWTEEWVKYHDNISSKIDISYDAFYRQCTIYLRSVDSQKQGGPLCQRPDYKTSADALASISRTRQRSTSYSNELADKVKRHIGSLIPTTCRMVEFQMEDVLLVIFILNMVRKPNVAEFFSLGPPMARMALSRVARERMVGSGITTTTPESRTDLYNETCTEKSERKDLNCCQVHLNLDSMCSLAHFSDFVVLSGNFASRQWQLP